MTVLNFRQTFGGGLGTNNCAVSTRGQFYGTMRTGGMAQCVANPDISAVLL